MRVVWAISIIVVLAVFSYNQNAFAIDGVDDGTGVVNGAGVVDGAADIKDAVGDDVDGALVVDCAGGLYL